MVTKYLKNILNQLDLIENEAVFFKNQEDGQVFSELNSDITNKFNRINPDAYYIFNKQPLILFFDLTNETNKNREKEIHKQVWSFDNSPVIFILKNTEAKIYNALNYSKKEESLEEIKLTKEERNSRFSFWQLQSGATWKWLQNEYFENQTKKQHRKRVNERLFQNIKEVREYLTLSTNPLTENQANSLILRLIFIRYLIDRKVKIDTEYISGELNDINERRKSFINLIKQPSKLNLLFEKLNEKFNGVLFKNLDITLNQIQSNDLASIFKGELQDGNNLFNGFFFEIFDFSIIPVEVISGIYESLIDEETRKLDSAVYTPPFLVEYVLNDTVDKYLGEQNTSECKIFEVAVGSGIFLVQSLRKMIDKELELNPNQSAKDFSERIREIAKENLFGIDINEEALKVACFSIYIALLDYQNPKDIDSYEFPNLLNTNLFNANFFDTSNKFNAVIKEEKPKFILGNPPWKNGGKDKIHVDYLKQNKLIGVVSDYQLAQSFVLRTKDFSKNESTPICALVVTSKVFYNNNATNFKKNFLSEFYLKKYLDLSPVRRDIFKNAINPSSVILFKYANNKNTYENQISFFSIKKNLFLKKFKMLVFEKQDIKTIPQKYFIEHPYMFKIATYGNTLDFKLIKRIKNKTNNYSLQSLFNEKSIVSGKGLFRGTPKKHYPYLEGKTLVKRKELKKYYTPFNDNYFTFQKEDTYLEAGRTESLFNGKKIIIQKSTDKETNIKFTLLENGYAFDSTVYGITFNNRNEYWLKIVYSMLLSELYTYYQFITSSSWGIYRPELLKTEHLSFPFVEPSKKEKNLLISNVDLFLNKFKNHYSKFSLGNIEADKSIFLNIDSIINELYNITEHEKDLIDYTLNISRYQFQENKQHLVSDFTYNDQTHYRNRDLVLKEYASIYIKEFQEIYNDEYIQVEIYPLDHFIALNVIFSSEKPKEQITYPKNKKTEEEVLKRLANNLSISQITNTTDSSKNLFIQKDIKGFENNSFYIIKPNEYKCWHRAMAWYDIAEFKEAIQEAELNELNDDA